MRIRIIASLCAGLGLIAASGSASAGIWSWRCQGQLGEQQVIFNRDSMAVIDSKKPLGDIRKSERKTEALLQDAAVTYDPNPDDSQRQHVLRAAASCPVQAIILELDPPADRDTK